MTCKAACKPLLNRDELRHRIAIQRLTETPDGKGAFTSGWTTVMQAWASIKPSSGLEKWRSEQMETQYTHKLRMAYQRGITTKHRILFGTRVFDIKEVLNIDERNIALELRCLEGPTHG